MQDQVLCSLLHLKVHDYYSFCQYSTLFFFSLCVHVSGVWKLFLLVAVLMGEEAGGRHLPSPPALSAFIFISR